MKQVDMIASGYEWTCPKDNTLNHEIEAAEQVTCKVCKTEYYASAPEHCYA